MTKAVQITNDEVAGPEGSAALAYGLRHALFSKCATWVSSLMVHLVTFAIRGYQLTISPAQTFLFGGNGACRFTPSCSAYAVDALREHGALTGTKLAIGRICRCHPWGGCGDDPVPSKNPRSKIQNPNAGVQLNFHG